MQKIAKVHADRAWWKVWIILLFQVRAGAHIKQKTTSTGMRDQTIQHPSS